MPIYVYECPSGHVTEFLKLKQNEPEPKFCGHTEVYDVHSRLTSSVLRTHMDKCGLPLSKVVRGTNWKWTRGKNPTWPLADPVDPTPQGPDEVY